MIVCFPFLSSLKVCLSPPCQPLMLHALSLSLSVSLSVSLSLSPCNCKQADVNFRLHLVCNIIPTHMDSPHTPTTQTCPLDLKFHTRVVFLYPVASVMFIRPFLSHIYCVNSRNFPSVPLFLSSQCQMFLLVSPHFVGECLCSNV